MKRAQSVEVLSILSESPVAVPASRTVATNGGVLPASFFAVEASGLLPPNELPPPLPPREKSHQPPPPPTAAPLVAAVLNFTPALVNDNLLIADKQQTVGPPSLRAGGVKSAAAAKSSPPGRPVAAPVHATAPAAVTAAAKKPMQKRPSAGVLFGIKDKELPAPDTVKEVRKLFELNSAAGSGGSFRGSSLTKSRSTSSLYTRPAAARTESLERLTAASRKKSEEDLLHPRIAGRRTAAAPAAARSQTVKQNGRSPSPRIASGFSSSSPRRSPSVATNSSGNNSSPSRNGRPASSPTTPVVPILAGRPLIPAKPSHLSPIVVGRSQAASTTATTVGFKSTSGRRQSPSTPVTKELDVIRLNLHPIGPTSSPPPPSSHEVDSVNHHRRREATTVVEEEDGVKRISEAAILNIRKEAANVVNFNFHEKAATNGGGVKSHLPGGSPPTEYRPLMAAKQACSTTVVKVFTTLLTVCNILIVNPMPGPGNAQSL